MWYIRNLNRVKREEAAIDALREEVDWLAGVAWTFDQGRLAVDAVITAHGHAYAVRMTYPGAYPAAPPTIQPAAAEHWSTHQYGYGGSLCLEYSGDTWATELTGADILISTHRLLEFENPRGAGGSPAPSRHQLTLGQEVRNSALRLLVRPELLNAIRETTERHGILVRADFWDQDAHVTVVTAATTFSGELWRDEQLPGGVQVTRDQPGLFIKTDAPLEELRAIKEITALDAVLSENNTLQELLSDYFPHPQSDPMLSLLLLDAVGQAAALTAFFKGSEATLYTTAIIEPEPAGQQQRSSEAFASLAQKRVGIIGLGSVGSKVALSMARAGVRRFYLLDEDLLLPENLQRHALDFQYVGQHKTRALATVLKRLAPNLEVRTSEMNLTGQENNALLDHALTELGNCDVIIDATASPDVFRLLAEVALTYRTPLAWGKVFGGGIGGLAARSRPDFDPSPAALHAAFLSYCDANPFESDTVYVDYSLQLGDGAVVIASDIEVGILAHHLALLVVDTLIEADSTRFPYPLYLIGLTRVWVFEQPFHVIPIIPESASNGWEHPGANGDVSQAIRFLVELVQKRGDCDDKAPT